MRDKTKSGATVARLTVLGFSLAALALPNSVQAQMADQAELRELKSRNSVSAPAAVTPFSLLDLSRIQWSHSYSFSYGSSSHGSGSYGMFSSAMYYEFSPSLSLALGVGVGHNPSALFNENVNSTSELFPAFSLDYHPNSKFRLNLTVARTPYYYGPNNYYSPYGYGAAGTSRSLLFDFPSSFDRR